MSLVIALDIGGTFTDLVAFDFATGAIHQAKSSTTPRDLSIGIRETLPEGFQTAEFLVERGMVDRVVTRKDLPTVLGSILGTLMMGRDRKAA